MNLSAFSSSVLDLKGDIQIIVARGVEYLVYVPESVAMKTKDHRPQLEST
jgi:hypothetical protein